MDKQLNLAISASAEPSNEFRDSGFSFFKSPGGLIVHESWEDHSLTLLLRLGADSERIRIEPSEVMGTDKDRMINLLRAKVLAAMKALKDRAGVTA